MPAKSRPTKLDLSSASFKIVMRSANFRSFIQHDAVSYGANLARTADFQFTPRKCAE